jgi:hypothetical protein
LLKFPTDESSGAWLPSIEESGVRVHFVAVRARSPADTASKAGKATTVVISTTFPGLSPGQETRDDGQVLLTAYADSAPGTSCPSKVGGCPRWPRGPKRKPVVAGDLDRTWTTCGSGSTSWKPRSSPSFITSRAGVPTLERAGQGTLKSESAKPRVARRAFERTGHEISGGRSVWGGGAPLLGAFAEGRAPRSSTERSPTPVTASTQ